MKSYKNVTLYSNFVIMTVTIETSGIQEVEQLLTLLKTLNIKNINIHASSSAPQLRIMRGDKKIDPKRLFGIWKNNPRTIEQIRSTALQECHPN